MKVLALAVAVAACQKPVDVNGLPVVGGTGTGHGGGGGGGGSTDAHSIDGAGASERVCLTSDARMLTACASTGADGLTVTLGNQMATTNPDGSFALTPPQGLSTWTVTGSKIVTSLEPFTPSFQIPALTDTTFQDLESSNGVIQSAGQGSLFVSIVHNGAPLAGATASIAPAAQFATLYDGSSATAWATMATGALGVAWLAGATAGTVTLTVTPMGGTAVQFAGIPIADGANTYVTVGL